MNRHAALQSLIRFDAPIPDLEARLRSFGWDSDEVVTLTRRHIADVLERYGSGRINATAVEAWANLIECREDIRIEPHHDKIVRAAIHDLANPELQGKLQDIAPRILSSLSQGPPHAI
ncbi:hypothetical protein [Bradyrhizobium sp. CCBAU 53421]|uniref:hypothetical protein n=1 Tax=Bradyrhizobium sp. CCBAU 53421 TaxID=1325120 RepID=UPI001889D2F8|nr:hypothetical protein [Bradyrhizobium sp. CCBAU 53421]QOZ37367.1 hypothetical protein XH92_42285 [Bradyrhizobium sp. CCBAU 53421]